MARRYAEIFLLEASAEVLVWPSRADARDDAGAKADMRMQFPNTAQAREWLAQRDDIESPDVRRCNECNRPLDPHAGLSVVYCGRCGEARIDL